MDYQRLLALLEERRALLLWDELWPDVNDQGGELVRQMRVEEIEDQVRALVGTHNLFPGLHSRESVAWWVANSACKIRGFGS